MLGGEIERQNFLFNAKLSHQISWTIKIKLFLTIFFHKKICFLIFSQDLINEISDSDTTVSHWGKLK